MSQLSVGLAPAHYSRVPEHIELVVEGIFVLYRNMNGSSFCKRRRILSTLRTSYASHSTGWGGAHFIPIGASEFLSTFDTATRQVSLCLSSSNFARSSYLRNIVSILESHERTAQMSLLILHHLVGYLSDLVQFKIARAAQAAREAARQRHSKLSCPGTPHNGTNDVLHLSRYFLFILKNKTT